MEPPALYARRIESRIAESRQDAPVVLLAGPRLGGKTTLARQIATDNGLRYLTLDDELTLLSAREDPVGMIRSLDHAVIDEIQRAPKLLLAIKKSVDEDRRPGRFLLTEMLEPATLLILDELTFLSASFSPFIPYASSICFVEVVPERMACNLTPG